MRQKFLKMFEIFETKTYSLSISSANGGSISGSTKDTYNSGERVNLTANREQCYAFTGWGGACSGTSSNCQLTMDTNKSVSANFEIQSFKLNISSDNGIVERQPNKTVYDCGETVKLTVRPNQAYKFTAWSGDANSTNESITINMDTDLNITAMFTKVQDLNIEPNFAEINLNGNQILTVSGGTEPYKWSSSNSGQLTPTSGKQVNFSAHSSNNQGYHITVTDNNGETASAIVKVYDLKVTPSGPLTLGFGETIKLTASGGRPKYNWTVTNGQLSAKQGSSTTYIAPNIAGDHIITLTDDRGEKLEVKVTVIAELICSPTIATVILGDPNPITFKAAGGAEPYSWSADNGIINPIEGPEANYQPPAQTGEYHVTCKDNKDSSIMSIVRVVPSVTITPTQIDLAAGAVTTLEVTGGQKPYIWTIKGTGELSSSEGSRVSYTAPTRNGIYTIIVMDALQQEAKARIQVLGNLIISPIKTVVAIGENVHLSVARGAEPYTWQDGSTGRTWNTKFNTVGRKEIVVTDAANDTALAIVEIIHDQLGLTPQNAYINPSEVINFSISGGTSPYVWNVEAGTLSSLKGTRVAYIAPNQPGKYNITVTDGRDVQGQAKVIVKADVIELKSGTARNDMGSINSNIIVDGVERHENEIFVDTASNIEASFSLELPNDGKNYKTYGAIHWFGLEEQPVLFFKTSTQPELLRFDPNQEFPIYKTTTAGEKVVVKNIYNGPLSNNSGQKLVFYLGYAPVGTNVLETLLFNATQPYNVLVK